MRTISLACVYERTRLRLCEGKTKKTKRQYRKKKEIRIFINDGQKLVKVPNIGHDTYVMIPFHRQQ